MGAEANRRSMAGTFSIPGSRPVEYAHNHGVHSFMPSGLAEWITLVGALVVSAPLGVVVLRKVGSPMPISTTVDAKFIEWERDRVLSVAKGTAATSLGFITALVMALLQAQIKADVSGLSVVGCLAGAVGLLLCAAQMNLAVRVVPVSTTTGGRA